MQAGGFLQKYVFPDGELLNINEMLASAETSGFETSDIEGRNVESLREHYALTLRHWIRNLEANQDQAVAATDERTYRNWRMYMAGYARGFENGPSPSSRHCSLKAAAAAARYP